jgi:hypothetical protein
MKPILALLFALQSTVAFAEIPTNLTVDHPQLRARGMSESQMQIIFNAQAGQCKGQAAVLANSTYPNQERTFMETLRNGGVGVGALSGGQAVQREAAKQQLFDDAKLACMIEKGWVFTPKP